MFQHYKRVYTLWSRVVKVWNFHFVGQLTQVHALIIDSIAGWSPNIEDYMAFDALIWFIWRARNRVIFHQIFSKDGCFKMFHFNLFQWVKSEWGKQVPMVTKIAWCLRQIGESLHPKLRRGKWVWTPLDIRAIKVNVDHSFLAGSRKGANGEAFRDFRGNILLQF